MLIKNENFVVDLNLHLLTEIINNIIVPEYIFMIFFVKYFI